MAESAARPPVAIRITRPYADEEEFLANELETLGKTSVILLGAEPRAAGVVLRFEVVLRSGAVLLRGEGRVLAHKENAFRGQAGLGLRFTRLDPRSKALVDRAVALRDAKGMGRGKSSAAPARPSDVAPAPSEPDRTAGDAAASSGEHAVESAVEAASASEPAVQTAVSSAPVLDDAATAEAPASEQAAPSVDIDIPISVELPASLATPSRAAPGIASARAVDRDALLARLRQRASGLDPSRVAAILGKR